MSGKLCFIWLNTSQKIISMKLYRKCFQNILERLLERVVSVSQASTVSTPLCASKSRGAEVSPECLFSRVLWSGVCGSVSYVMPGACTARNLGSFTRLILHSLSSAPDIWSLAIPLVPGEFLREVLIQVVRQRGEKKTGSSFPFRSRGGNAHSPGAMPCRLSCLVQD